MPERQLGSSSMMQLLAIYDIIHANNIQPALRCLHKCHEVRHGCRTRLTAFLLVVSRNLIGYHCLPCALACDINVAASAQKLPLLRAGIRQTRQDTAFVYKRAMPLCHSPGGIGLRIPLSTLQGGQRDQPLSGPSGEGLVCGPRSPDHAPLRGALPSSRHWSRFSSAWCLITRASAM